MVSFSPYRYHSTQTILRYTIILFSHSHHKLHIPKTNPPRVPHPPFPNHYLSTPRVPHLLAVPNTCSHYSNTFRSEPGQDPVIRFIFGQINSASGHEIKPFPHFHVALTYWRTNWNPRTLSRLYNYLDGFPLRSSQSHPPTHTHYYSAPTGQECEKKKKKNGAK